jgi:hypothetical protein
MVAVRPDPSSATERTVHGAGETDRESAGATRKRTTVRGSRDEMDVVVLDGEFDDPEFDMRT